MSKSFQTSDFVSLMNEVNENLINSPISDFENRLKSQMDIIRKALDISCIHLFLLNPLENQYFCKIESKKEDISKTNPIFFHLKTFEKEFIENHLKVAVFIDETTPLLNILELNLQHVAVILPLYIDNQMMGFISLFDQKEHQNLKQIELEHFKPFILIITLQFHRIFLLETSKDYTLKQDISKTKERFISNISHEIRTPLSGIFNSFYLLEETHLSEEQQSYIDIGKSSLNIISNILNDLIDYSNLEKDKIQISKDVFDLEDELTQLIHHLKKTGINPNIDIKLCVDQNIDFKFIGDYRKIRQIILNLLDNALKYTKKGMIEMNAECMSIKDHAVKIRIEIKDSGIGMDESEIEQIHTPLKQIDDQDTKSYQGLGLGFSIANQFAKLIGANISVSSQKYKGTIMTLSLDLIKGEDISYPEFNQIHVLFSNRLVTESKISNQLLKMGAICHDFKNNQNEFMDIVVFEEEVPHQSEIDRIRRLYGHEKTMMILCKNSNHTYLNHVDQSLLYPISKQDILKAYKSYQKRFIKHDYEKAYHELLSGHVMIVDDNRLNRLALESVLSKLGMRSTLVDSGNKAIETVQRDNYDIIFMDVQMPIMDGIEATRKIRNLGKAYEDIPIIAVTANAYFKDYDLLKSAKINDVIFKPIQMDQLNFILRKHLERKTKMKVPSELLVFDEIDFNLRFEGAMDIAVEVINTFLTEYSSDLKKIKQAIDQKVSNEIIETAHYFKGSCSYLSAKKTVWVLDIILNDAKHQKLDQMELLYELLQELVNEVILTLKKKMNI